MTSCWEPVPCAIALCSTLPCHTGTGFNSWASCVTGDSSILVGINISFSINLGATMPLIHRVGPSDICICGGQISSRSGDIALWRRDLRQPLPHDLQIRALAPPSNHRHPLTHTQTHTHTSTCSIDYAPVGSKGKVHCSNFQSWASALDIISSILEKSVFLKPISGVGSF
jgi:hypothetical protein